MGSGDDGKGIQPAAASTEGIQYAIRVRGHLDAHWSEWLDGMTITHEEGGVTRLRMPWGAPPASVCGSPRVST